MSDQKPPRWKSEVTRPDPARPEATLPQPIRIETGDVAAAQVESSSADGSKADRSNAEGRKPVARKKPVPKQAIMIGIAGGAVLGALLAWGVLSFIWWRRDVNREADFAAEVKAQQEAEARKKQAEMNDAMRQFSIQQGKR
jgi:hypothetical protein